MMATDLYLGKACAGEPTWVPSRLSNLDPRRARDDHVIIAQEGVVPGEAELAEARVEAAIGQIDVDALGLDRGDVLQEARDFGQLAVDPRDQRAGRRDRW